MLKSIFLLSLVIFCYSCKIQNDKFQYDAVVDAGFAGEVGEKIDDIPVYTNLEQALDIIPLKNNRPFRIFIKKGVYYEKLSINKPFVFLKGEDRDATIITYDATGDSRSETGESLGTRGCFSLRIAASDFRAEDLTIENSFDYPANAAKADDDPTRIQNPQAVALFTTAGNDRAVFINCVLRGFQDTLFTDSGRHYFLRCRILGHVDFIFGAGQVVFNECEIISRNRQKKDPTGYITAPSTKISIPYGFLFINCRLLKESNVPAGSVRLGRPWHPGGDLTVSGSAVFNNCFMDDHIGPDGYAPISARDSSGRRIWFEVKEDSRFFEFGSSGPGAVTSPARPVLDSTEARWYTANNVLCGWQPEKY